MENTTNVFRQGLATDLNPMTISNQQLSDALNATMLTFNGNEMLIQNDMGNVAIETDKGVARLSKGFIPVGMQEHGGVLYIASYNDQTGEGELGTIPSPDIVITSTSEKKLVDLPLYTNVDENVDTSVLINNNAKFFNSIKTSTKISFAGNEEVTLKVGDVFWPTFTFQDQLFSEEQDRLISTITKDGICNKDGVYNVTLQSKIANGNIVNVPVYGIKSISSNENKWRWFLQNEGEKTSENFLVYPNIPKGQLCIDVQLNVPEVSVKDTKTQLTPETIVVKNIVLDLGSNTNTPLNVTDITISKVTNYRGESLITSPIKLSKADDEITFGVKIVRRNRVFWGSLFQIDRTLEDRTVDIELELYYNVYEDMGGNEPVLLYSIFLGLYRYKFNPFYVVSSVQGVTEVGEAMYQYYNALDETTTPTTVLESYELLEENADPRYNVYFGAVGNSQIWRFMPGFSFLKTSNIQQVNNCVEMPVDVLKHDLLGNQPVGHYLNAIEFGDGNSQDANNLYESIQEVIGNSDENSQGYLTDVGNKLLDCSSLEGAIDGLSELFSSQVPDSTFSLGGVYPDTVSAEIRNKAYYFAQNQSYLNNLAYLHAVALCSDAFILTSYDYGGYNLDNFRLSVPFANQSFSNYLREHTQTTKNVQFPNKRNVTKTSNSGDNWDLSLYTNDDGKLSAISNIGTSKTLEGAKSYKFFNDQFTKFNFNNISYLYNQKCYTQVSSQTSPIFISAAYSENKKTIVPAIHNTENEIFSNSKEASIEIKVGPTDNSLESLSKSEFDGIIKFNSSHTFKNVNEVFLKYKITPPGNRVDTSNGGISAVTFLLINFNPHYDIVAPTDRKSSYSVLPEFICLNTDQEETSLTGGITINRIGWEINNPDKNSCKETRTLAINYYGKFDVDNQIQFKPTEASLENVSDITYLVLNINGNQEDANDSFVLKVTYNGQTKIPTIEKTGDYEYIDVSELKTLFDPNDALPTVTFLQGCTMSLGVSNNHSVASKLYLRNAGLYAVGSGINTGEFRLPSSLCFNEGDITCGNQNYNKFQHYPSDPYHKLIGKYYYKLENDLWKPQVELFNATGYDNIKNYIKDSLGLRPTQTTSPQSYLPEQSAGETTISSSIAINNLQSI